MLLQQQPHIHLGLRSRHYITHLKIYIWSDYKEPVVHFSLSLQPSWSSQGSGRHSWEEHCRSLPCEEREYKEHRKSRTYKTYKTYKTHETYKTYTWYVTSLKQYVHEIASGQGWINDAARGRHDCSKWITAKQLQLMQQVCLSLWGSWNRDTI